MDLSWPRTGGSVNSQISKDYYLDRPCNLRYPTTDDLCKRVTELYGKRQGKRILGWKKDMTHAFKQVLLCPSSWPALGMYWLGALYFDKTAVMGCRSVPYVCQRTTNVIRHIMRNISYIIYNYIDDFMSVEHEDRAWASYHVLGNLLRDLGVFEAEDKVVPPTEVIEFLGILYDLVNMCIQLPEDKKEELKQELRQWVDRRFMTKWKLQKITGKLQFAAACIREGRVFINRQIYYVVATKTA